jgi:hypothetical protein
MGPKFAASAWKFQQWHQAVIQLEEEVQAANSRGNILQSVARSGARGSTPQRLGEPSGRAPYRPAIAPSVADHAGMRQVCGSDPVGPGSTGIGHGAALVSPQPVWWPQNAPRGSQRAPIDICHRWVPSRWPKGGKKFQNRLAVAARQFAACRCLPRKITRIPLGNGVKSRRERGRRSGRVGTCSVPRLTFC